MHMPLFTSSSALLPPVAAANDTLACDPNAMQQQLALFVRDGVLDSAQLLAELLLALAAAPPSEALRAHLATSGSRSSSSMSPDDCVRAFHAQTYLLFADLLVVKREYKRAIYYYKRHWKLVAAAPATAAATADTNSVKLKIAECWLELETVHHAMELLTSIPSHARSLRVNLLLGKLYRHEDVRSKAEECYTRALRQNPYALEAALALAELTATRDSSAAISGSTSSSISTSGGGSAELSTNASRNVEQFYAALAVALPPAATANVARVDAAWMQTLVSAHANAARGRYRASVEAFDALDHVFPSNLHGLLHRGQLELAHEFFHQAHLQFHRARQVDALNVALMDVHADCLRKNNARTQLSALVHDLFETSDRDPAVWLAAAYYSDMKGEHETALAFCDRAVAADRRHAAAHLFRGALLLTLERPEHALAAFTASSKLVRSLDAYAGIVSSYCDLCNKGVNRYKEAVATAKSVVKLFPHRAHAFMLLGTVFALRPETKEHARKAFQRALALEPRKLAAIFGLVDLLVHEGNFSAAIDRLVNLSEQYAREEVFTKLGDIYTLNKQFGDALAQYHRSLSLNPAAADALRGLDRLEKLMRGENPDELSTTMDDHLEPDDADDSMDADEYSAAS